MRHTFYYVSVVVGSILEQYWNTIMTKQILLHFQKELMKNSIYRHKPFSDEMISKTNEQKWNDAQEGCFRDE